MNYLSIICQIINKMSNSDHPYKYIDFFRLPRPHGGAKKIDVFTGCGPDTHI
jgi:hypothetical protein